MSIEAFYDAVEALCEFEQQQAENRCLAPEEPAPPRLVEDRHRLLRGVRRARADATRFLHQVAGLPAAEAADVILATSGDCEHLQREAIGTPQHRSRLAGLGHALERSLAICSALLPRDGAVPDWLMPPQSACSVDSCGAGRQVSPATPTLSQNTSSGQEGVAETRSPKQSAPEVLAALPTMLSASDLAREIGQPTPRVETFLRRFHKKHPECRHEVDNPRRNEPRYLYSTVDVWPALQQQLPRWQELTDS
jgi:hypothetical protein